MAFGDFTVDRNSTKYVLGSGGDIISYATDEPAFEFNSDGSYKGLLVEPAATNYDTASSTIVTGWSEARVTKSADQTTAPDGVATSADSVLETIDNDTHFIYKDYTLGAGSYIFSCFVKSIGGRNFQLNPQALGGGGSGGGPVQFNLSTGTVASGTGTITEIGDGWYRVSGSAVTAGATGIRVIAYSLDGTATTFAGDVTKGFYMWGMQVEAGPIATSYIPTTGSQENRVADDIELTSASSLIGQTEGTIYVEADWRLATGTRQYLLRLQSSTVNGDHAYFRGSDASDVIRFQLEQNGSAKVTDTTRSSDITGIQKIAFAYASANSKFAINGTAYTPSVNNAFAFTSTLDQIFFNSSVQTQQPNMWIRAVALFTRRLSDAELQALTTL